jgi:hypothetical protein
VQAKSTKEGDKNGKHWIKFAIKLNGEWYSTFKADMIQPERDEEITVTYKDDGKYKTLVSWVPANAAETTDAQEESTDDAPRPNPPAETTDGEQLPF